MFIILSINPSMKLSRWRKKICHWDYKMRVPWSWSQTNHNGAPWGTINTYLLYSLSIYLSCLHTNRGFIVSFSISFSYLSPNFNNLIKCQTSFSTFIFSLFSGCECCQDPCELFGSSSQKSWISAWCFQAKSISAVEIKSISG